MLNYVYIEIILPYALSFAAGAIGMAVIAILIPLLAGGTQYLSAWIAQKSTATNNKNDNILSVFNLGF